MKRLLIALLIFTLGITFTSAQEHGHPLSKSIVVVSTGFNMGTGFVVSYDGYFITCHHVVMDSDTVRLWATEPAGAYTGRVVSRDPMYDWALIKVDSNREWAPLDVDLSNSMRVGDEVQAMGHPFGIGWLFTKGSLSSVKYEGNGLRFLYVDISNAAGSSGSPLMNSKSEVVGMIQMGAPGVGAIGIGVLDVYDVIVATILNDRKLASRRAMLKAEMKRIEASLQMLLDRED